MECDARKLESLKDKLSMAKIELLEKQFCFFGVLSLYMKYYLSEEFPTAWTDGRAIYFNPKFLEELSYSELKWVIAHEIMHVANGHPRRRDFRDHGMFNEACDFAIHDILKQFEDRQEFSMPDFGLYDPKYKDLSAEDIYDDLKQNSKSDKNKSGKGRLLDSHDKWDDPDSGDGQSGGKKGEGSDRIELNEMNSGDISEMSEEEWEERKIKAAKIAQGKDCGKLPAYLQGILVKLEPPRKDWRQILQEFITPELFDYSFNPPDKRLYAISECMLPDFNDEQETVKNIVFFVDISGSMSSDDIKDVYSEVAGAVSQFDSMSGYLGYFDTSVHNFEPFEDIGDIIKNKPHSGGGTEFRVCFEYLHNSDKVKIEDVAGIIILTDGYCGYEGCEKLSEGIPTLWVDIEEQSEGNIAPFGNTIFLRPSSRRS
jgi:predicted metal-dependent peptidase